MTLNTLRQSWQRQPSPNTKRGKPHRASLKAGLWDEPPQLARALATGLTIRVGLTTRDQHKLRTCLLPNSPVLPGPCANYLSPD